MIHKINRKKIICLTPIKNESWILDKFLMATSLWADYIILADQNSTDNSLEIAAKFPKVRIIKNDNEYDEGHRSKIMLEKAREIEGQKILIALDADEFISGNFIGDSEWKDIHKLLPGTIIKFPWVNIRPGFDKYWLARNKPFGFVDDNHSENNMGKIHIDRLPRPAESRTFVMRHVAVLHLQYLDWNRMMSKQRWYQCWEKINQPIKPLYMYRKYHHMYSVKKTELQKIPREWLEGYMNLGLDITAIKKEDSYWWDRETLEFISTYGNLYFKKEAIWDVDWVKKAGHYKLDDVARYSDPRNMLDKTIHSWLKYSQTYYNVRPYTLIIKPFDRLISIIFRY